MKELELNKNKHIKLFSNCILVQGVARSIMCDVQRNAYTPIDRDMADTIAFMNGRTIDQIIAYFGIEKEEQILVFIEFLIEKEWAFTTTIPEQFPSLSLRWSIPTTVTNAIIQINSSTEPQPEVAAQLDRLECECLELQFAASVQKNLVREWLNLFRLSTIKCISIYLPFAAANTIDECRKICKKHYRVNNLVVYSALKHEHISLKNGTTILFYSNPVDITKACGQVYSRMFTLNMHSFTESHHHNSCLNRKIAIDVEGNIKNCPSMSQSFGNIRDTTLQQALDHPDFKKYWNVTKDQIEVCKDCEFRYICTDCRAYIENPDDMYSKPLKCGYNPYTCEWEEWSTNPLKQKAIDYYGMREVLPEFQLKPDFVPPAPAKN